MSIINKKSTYTSIVPPVEPRERDLAAPTEYVPPPPTLRIEVPVAALENAEVGASIEFKAKGTLVSKENRKTRRGHRICYGLEVREIAI